MHAERPRDQEAAGGLDGAFTTATVLDALGYTGDEASGDAGKAAADQPVRA